MTFFQGLPRRTPGALIFFPGHVVGAVYPATSDLSLNHLDTAGELPAELKAKSRLSWAEANTSPQLKGFAFCDIVDNISGKPSAINDPGNANANRINGKQINEDLNRVTTSFDYAFERDEYVYFYKRYSLVNIFGGL